MANPIEFFENIEKDTWIHRLDPRTKIISVVILATLPALFSHPAYLAFWMCFFFCIWYMAKMDIRPILALFYAGLVMVFVYIMYGTFLAYPADVLALAKVKIPVGPFLATDIGFYNGLILGYRLMVLLMPVVTVIATTEPSMMAKGFLKMGAPITISFVLLATLRFLPLVFEVAARVLDAQKVRGLKFRTLKDRTTNLKYLIMPLFINTLRQSRTLGLAVESKGFGARKWKEFYREFRMTTADWMTLAFVAFMLVATLYVRFGLGLGWMTIFRP
jgi:energy-coupling factor transport system permease protein